MSKQPSRQTSKREQTANKQSNNPSSKPASSASKQASNGSVKQDRPVNKQATGVVVNRNRAADKPLTRQAIKQERRQEERQRRLEERRRAARRKRFTWIGIVAVVVLLVAGVSAYAIINLNKPASSTHNPTATATEQVFNPAYPPVDGVYCNQLEHTQYHIHVHLSIWINGQSVPVPQGVGIASDQSCFYWLHTHDGTGVVHIEAPQTSSLNLGNFLDVWGQKFSQMGYKDQLSSSADWTIYVNGKQITGGFNKVVFQEHMLITIAYNSPNVKPDTTFSWPANT